MKIFSALDTRRSIICRGGVMSLWLLNEKSYRCASITTFLTPFSAHHYEPLSSFLPLLRILFRFSVLSLAPFSSPFLRSPVSGIILSMEQLIRRPFHPPEADSAERSETIKSTAESTLPCKLAHCQAQRFTVTCIAYIYIYISFNAYVYYYY